MELAELQDQEVGDGTTSVVIFAAELLKRANNLVRNRIHPTSIISGYRLAMREVWPSVLHEDTSTDLQWLPLKQRSYTKHQEFRTPQEHRSLKAQQQLRC